MKRRRVARKHHKARHTYEPESDPLFRACFECPYPDCCYHVDRARECPFRVKWGREHGVEPHHLAGLKEYKHGRGRPRKI